MPRLIWVFAGCTLILLVLSCHSSFIFEPRHEKMCLRESPTRQDTNWPAQLQRPARILKFRIHKLEESFCLRQRTTKALIRLRRCAGWSVPLLFAYGIKHIFSWPGSFSNNIWILGEWEGCYGSGETVSKVWKPVKSRKSQWKVDKFWNEVVPLVRNVTLSFLRKHNNLCSCLPGLWWGKTETGLLSYRSKLESWNFWYRN